MRLFPSILLVAAAVACMKEPVFTEENPAAKGRTIEVSMPEMTRTALGESDQTRVSVVWSKGDEIAVIENKGTSQQKHSVYRLVGEGGSASGTFEYVSGNAVNEIVTDVVFPADAVGNNYEVPTNQTYVEDSFDTDAMIMSWTRKSEGESIILSHEAAAFMITLTGAEEQKISSIEISAEGKTYRLICPKSIALSSEGKTFYVAVPGSDSECEYNFTINSTIGAPMARKTRYALNAGKIGRLPVTAFKPLAVGNLYCDGLVFEVTDNYAKIVSLDEGSCKWASDSNTAAIDIGTESNPDEGDGNTDLFRNRSDLDKFPAVKWCIDHGEGWYMPSRVEIVNVVNSLGLNTADGLNATNTALSAAGGATFTQSSYYWTSCESERSGEGSKVYTIRLSDKGASRLNKYSSSSDRPVRAVKKAYFTVDSSESESDIIEPDFGEEVKILPEAGTREKYSPSKLSKYYRPVSTKFKYENTEKWINAKARIVPYLDGFKNYQMTRSEYTESTNRYGSSTLLPRQDATGRFYIKKINGRFWFVDPEGYLNHHRGVAAMRPSTNGAGADNDAFINKYGNRSTWLSIIQDELAGIGFHSSGAFSTVYDDIISHNNNHPDRPILLCPSFSFLSTFRSQYKLSYCDGTAATAVGLVLDENWEKFCEEYISKGGVQKFLNDPNVVGIFSDNEINFSSLSGRLLDKIIDSQNTSHPTYKAAMEFMAAEGASVVTDELNLKWAGMLAEKYYKGVKTAIEKYDPGLLYFGSRLHGLPKLYESVVRAAGKWCDVISFNYYSSWSVDALTYVSDWEEWAPETPFIVSEFYTKAEDSNLDNSTGAGFLVPTQQDRAFAYQHFTLGLLESRHCVGWHWFKYQDDDPADYEHPANKGLYDTGYKLYPWMAEYAKTLNYNVYRLIEYFDN